MSNIVVSSICNMNCAYCFARDHLGRQSKQKNWSYISMEAYQDRLSYLKRSGIDEVRMIGGEPTLHPQFPELVQIAKESFNKIMVFTHGFMDRSALRCLVDLSPDQVTVLVNANAGQFEDTGKTTESSRRKKNLSHLGERATLGYTIASTDFDCDYLLPLILETGCKKSIRLGLSQPILTGANKYLYPRQYPFVGKKVTEFVSRAASYGITVEFDCGFVRCMFSQSEYDLLLKFNKQTYFRCNPVLDIDLEGQISHCFPLAGRYQQPLTSSVLAADIRAALAEQIRPYRLAGIFKECSTCKFKREGECTGGCLALTILQFRQSGFRLAMSEEKRTKDDGVLRHSNS